MLRVEEVTVSYGGITALDRISVEVAAGEIVGVIGPNGAGKTTLFDVISGVQPARRGQVFFDDEDVTGRSSVERFQRGLRRTFQRVQTFGWLTVEDNVLVPLECRRGFRRGRERARRDQAVAQLERCGLGDVIGELAGSLPIGSARMVELARATVDAPRLLLLDEPISGLDDKEARRVAAEIHRVRDATGCAVLLVEHDAAFVMEQCDRVIVLDQGRVLTHGTPAEIQAHAEVRDAYLGVEA